MTDRPYRVLMVCTGNICRSPTAEGVFRKMVSDAGLDGKIEVDGAGTTNWHTGDSPSRLAVEQAEKRGYNLSVLKARQITDRDYAEFDLILAMDEGHMNHLRRDCPPGARSELAMFLDASPDAGRKDVPDPYYGGAEDYRYALDLIETGCRAWLDIIRDRV